MNPLAKLVVVSAVAVPAVCVPVSSAALGAQGPVGPARLGSVGRSVALNPPSVPGTAVLDVHAAQPPSSAAGQWICVLTVQDLDPAHGGQGGSDLLLGILDPANHTFSPTRYADACNTALNEHSAGIDPSGLHLVFERVLADGAGTVVMHASRSSLAAPFDPATVVSGLPQGPIEDPAIGTVDGQACLFYAAGGTLNYAPFDPTTSNVDGPAIVAVGPDASGARPAAPTPLCDPFGTVTGLAHTSVLGAESDARLTADLHASTPSHTAHELPSWVHDLGVTGGLWWARDDDGDWFAEGLAWLTGSVTPIGGTAVHDVRYPPRAQGPAPVSVAALAVRPLPIGVSIPGIGNQLGLDLGTLLLLQQDTPDDPKNGRGELQFQIPTNTQLIGARIYMQSIWVPSYRGPELSNTATLEITAPRSQDPFPFPYDGRDHALPTPVDPDNPVVVVTAPGTNRAPVTVVAQDSNGFDVGDPVEVRPGATNSISQPGAVRYVIRTPRVPGATGTVDTGPAAAGWVTHLPNAEFCRDRGAANKYRFALGADDFSYCVHVQGKASQQFPSDCRVRWAMHHMDHNGVPVGDPIAQGTVDRFECETRCLPAQPGGHPLVGVVLWCDNGPNVCRFRIQFRRVQDCSDCAQARPYPCR